MAAATASRETIDRVLSREGGPRPKSASQELIGRILNRGPRSKSASQELVGRIISTYSLQEPKRASRELIGRILNREPGKKPKTASREVIDRILSRGPSPQGTARETISSLLAKAGPKVPHSGASKELISSLLKAKAPTPARSGIRRMPPSLKKAVTQPKVQAWTSYLKDNLSSWFTPWNAMKLGLYLGAAAATAGATMVVAGSLAGVSVGTTLSVLASMSASQFGNAFVGGVTTGGITYAAKFATRHAVSALRGSERVGDLTSGILDAKIAPRFIAHLARKTGLSIEELSVGDLGSSVLQNGLSFYMGGPYIWAASKIVSGVLGQSPKATRALKKATVISARGFARLTERIYDLLLEDLELFRTGRDEFVFDVSQEALSKPTEELQKKFQEDVRRIIVEESVKVVDEAQGDVVLPFEAKFESSDFLASASRRRKKAEKTKKATRDLETSRTKQREATIRSRRAAAVPAAAPKERVPALKERVPVSRRAAAVKTEEDTVEVFDRFVKEHSTFFAAGTLAATVVGAALGADIVGQAAGQAMEMAAANETASKALFTIVTKMGIGKLASSLGLQESQAARLKKAHAKTLASGDPGRVSKFLASMTGRRVYGKKALNEMTTTKLRKIATSRGIRLPRGDVDRASLLKAIRSSEAEDLTNLQRSVEGFLAGVITSAIAGVAAQGATAAVQAYEQARLDAFLVQDSFDQRVFIERFTRQAAEDAAREAAEAQRIADLNAQNDLIMAQIESQRLQGEIAKVQAALDERFMQGLEAAAERAAEEARIAELNAQNDAILAAMEAARVQAEVERMNAAFAEELARRAAVAEETARRIQEEIQRRAAEAATFETLLKIKDLAGAHVKYLESEGYDVGNVEDATKAVYDSMVGEFQAGGQEAIDTYLDEFAKVAAALGFPEMTPVPAQIPTFGPEIGIPGVSFDPATVAPTEGPVAPTLADLFEGPAKDILSNPKVIAALEDYQITPPLAYLAKQTAGTLASATVPPLAAVTVPLAKVNTLLQEAKAASYLSEFSERLYYASRNEDYSRPIYYDYLRSIRIPDVADLVDYVTGGTSQITASEIFKLAGADQLLNGQDHERLLLNIGRLALWGTMEDNPATQASDMAVRAAGQALYNAVFG